MRRVDGASPRLRARRWVVKLFESTPLLLLLLLFNVTGLRGIDYGYHWDEQDWQIDPVHHMLETGILLPGSYIYPSFCKWLTLLVAAPIGVRTWLASAGNPVAVQTAMLAAMANKHGFLLDARALFLVSSSLALVWVYGAALALRHRWWEALVAAAGLGLSWEYAYHCRYVATDCILAQFAALTVLLLALFRRYERPLWLHLAAVAAGLGTGSKYTGVFLLVPVLLAGVLSLPLRAIFAHVRRAALICSLALASYLLTTPATVLDPLRFIADARFISGYYAHTPHGGYTTSGALQHLKIALSYLSLAYFSPYPWLALLLFVAMLGGGVLWLRRDLRFGITVAVFPLIFLVYFCIQYRLAMVRNYLFLVPFLALLLARGIADLVHWLPRKWLRICAGAALGATLIAHASFLVAAGESIRDIDPQADVERALSYIAKRPNAAFRLSAKVRALAKAAQLVLPANVVSGQRGDHLVFFGQADGPGPWHWMTNDPWLTEAVFGPREVNLNWYSSWSGNDRVVVMTLEKARSAGIALAR